MVVLDNSVLWVEGCIRKKPGERVPGLWEHPLSTAVPDTSVVQHVVVPGYMGYGCRCRLLVGHRGTGPGHGFYWFLGIFRDFRHFLGIFGIFRDFRHFLGISAFSAVFGPIRQFSVQYGSFRSSRVNWCHSRVNWCHSRVNWCHSGVNSGVNSGVIRVVKNRVLFVSKLTFLSKTSLKHG